MQTRATQSDVVRRNRGQPSPATGKSKRLARRCQWRSLEYLPFAALPSPSSGQPLIAEHEVVNLPSASVLSAIRRETLGRQAASKAVAVFADPVFEANDPRVLAREDSAQPVGTWRSIPDQRGEPQTSSEHSIRYTVDAFCQKHSGSPMAAAVFRGCRSPARKRRLLLRCFPARSFLKATDFRANRATATSAELSNYRIVHFATHGLLNSQHPELSGLVLSLVDENGRSTGRLSAYARNL